MYKRQLGHGGYFSPQRYISTTIPVEYWARKARMSYSLNGAFGFQSIKQEGNVYFPTSALLQAQGQTALDTLVLLGLANAPLGANYEGRSRNGFAYNIAGSVEYALTNRLMLGGVIGLDNASDFQQFKLGLYLRFYMDQENPGVNAPPKAPNPFMD